MALLAQLGLLRVSETFQFLECANFYASRLWTRRKYGLLTRKGVDSFTRFYRWPRHYRELRQTWQGELSRSALVHLLREHVFKRSKHFGHTLLAKTGFFRNRPIQVTL